MEIDEIYGCCKIMLLSCFAGGEHGDPSDPEDSFFDYDGGTDPDEIYEAILREIKVYKRHGKLFMQANTTSNQPWAEEALERAGFERIASEETSGNRTLTIWLLNLKKWESK